MNWLFVETPLPTLERKSVEEAKYVVPENQISFDKLIGYKLLTNNLNHVNCITCYDRYCWLTAPKKSFEHWCYEFGIPYENRDKFFGKKIKLSIGPEGKIIQCPKSKDHKNNDEHPSAKIWSNGFVNCFKCGILKPQEVSLLTNSFKLWR